MVYILRLLLSKTSDKPKEVKLTKEVGVCTIMWTLEDTYVTYPKYSLVHKIRSLQAAEKVAKEYETEFHNPNCVTAFVSTLEEHLK